MPLRPALVLLALALAGPAADAQTVGRIEGRQATPGGGYYVNARAGEPTTRVYVWGGVRNPGVYEVGAGFDLQGVLTLAGLSVESEQDPGDPQVYVRVYRPSEGRVLYDAPVARFVLEPGAHPALVEGDVLTVGVEPAARVDVWGAVERPGLYEVGPEVDAQGILSLAGGPLLPTLFNNDRREVTIRYVRPGSAAPLFEGPLDAFTRERTALPDPQDGDVIEVAVRQRSGFTFRDVITITGGVAGIASAVVIAITQLNN